MMTNPMAIDAALDLLAPEHFYRPAHQVIYRAMVIMFAADQVVNPVTLKAWIEGDGEMKTLGGPAAGPMYLAELYGIPAHPAGLGQYAAIVVAYALRRRMAEEGTRLLSAARDGSLDPAVTLAAAADRIAAVTLASSRDKPDGMPLAEFMTTALPHAEPVIPGLLDHQDRVIVVGGEGAGKTTLGHQVGFCAAAGVHPFAGTRILPQRVLIMDAENPQRLLQRRFARLVEIASGYPGWDQSMVNVWIEPGGIDLGNPRQAFRAKEVVRRFRPDLIVAGPLYKLMTETGENPEIAHGRIARWFDQMRSLYGCALWLEHHAPLGGERRQMRPMGSGIWSRWPEYGITLHPATKAHGGRDALELGQFRGHRNEAVTWPERITRNRLGAGWPWLATFPQGTLTNEAPEETG